MTLILRLLIRTFLALLFVASGSVASFAAPGNLSQVAYSIVAQDLVAQLVDPANAARAPPTTIANVMTTGNAHAQIGNLLASDGAETNGAIYALVRSSIATSGGIGATRSRGVFSFGEISGQLDTSDPRTEIVSNASWLDLSTMTSGATSVAMLSKSKALSGDKRDLATQTDKHAPNSGFGGDIFVEMPRQNIGSQADNFTDGAYHTVRTTEEIVIYRSFGGDARLQGGYASPTQGASRADLAIEPDWGNTMRFEARVTVPSGTTLNVGSAGPQATLPGGGSQILMPRGWDGIPVNNNTVRITDTTTGRTYSYDEFATEFPDLAR